MTALSGLHLAFFWVAAALAVSLGALALADLVVGRFHRIALDRLVLALLVALIAPNVVGLAMLVAGARPDDPLHLLYGLAGPGALAAARWLGRRPHQRRRVGWLLGGAVVVTGVLLQLWTTGG